LAAALTSALAQEFENFEVVVVDDAVNGAAWDRRPELAGLLADRRVRRVAFHQGRGCAAAKNAGLRAARGTWICYLDDDNAYRPRKLAAQHTLATTSGSPVVLCGLAIRMGGRERIRQTDTTEFAGDGLLLEALADTNVLFHRRDAGVTWDESLGTVDDACFFHALVAWHRLSRVPNVPEPLAIYHAHGGARANRGFVRFYTGQRRLLVRWAKAYGPRARRILLLRSLVAFAKYRPGGWGGLIRHGAALLRVGGWREWRLVANTAGVKLPVLRRWLVT
jgi:glycosyltransferase involved in cell wall biosynthesis